MPKGEMCVLVHNLKAKEDMFDMLEKNGKSNSGAGQCLAKGHKLSMKK